MTAHRLLYRSKEKPDGTYVHIEKDHLDANYNLIVADEASMLPQEMIDLMLSHKVHVIFLGDTAQLPPIHGEQTILDNPHVFLDEVVRQALDNPIIKMSMNIRNGCKLHYGGDKLCRIMSPENVSDKLLLGADQILVGKNKTRMEFNTYMRKLIWGDAYTEEPINGDKVICLKNNWQVVGSDGNPLVNGQIGKLENVRICEINPYGKVVKADFVSEDGETYYNLMMDYKLFVEDERTINKDNWKKFVGKPKLFEFTFAQAITVHKYQGSEASKVIVFEEWLGDYESHKKWLYTAVTRASSQLVIVR